MKIKEFETILKLIIRCKCQKAISKIIHIMINNDAKIRYSRVEVRVSEYFFRYKEHRRHLGLNKSSCWFFKEIISFKSILDMLVFICRQMSAIHDVKVGKSLVSVVVLIELPIKWTWNQVLLVYWYRARGQYELSRTA